LIPRKGPDELNLKYKKRLILISALCVAAIFFVFRTFPRQKPGEHVVARVIDGDTIELNSGDRVRYIGIDTPETRKKNASGRWIYDPEAFGKEATELNRQLVEGKKIRLEFDIEKRDKYNRLLAYVFVGDVFVNARLVEEGLAQLLTIPPNVKYTDLFKKLQKKARGEKKGFWKAY
jgi:micrococcal nuclease